MKTTADNYKASVFDIIRAIFNQPGWAGITASGCGRCGATVNVANGGPGWFCPCGHFNVLSCSGFIKLFDSPTYGPPAWKIQFTYRLCNWIESYLQFLETWFAVSFPLPGRYRF